MTNASQEEEKAHTQSTKTAETGKPRCGQQIVTRIELAKKHPIGVIASMISAFLIFVFTIFGPLNLTSLLPSPTPQAFAPAKPGESLIIVADFEPRPKDAKLKDDPAQYIYEELKEQIRKDNLNIRVERLRQVVDDNTARPTGHVYRATMLLWGWYGDSAITPRIERFGLQTIPSDQESKRYILDRPERITNLLLNDLPTQTKYVVFYTLSLEQDDLQAALRLIDSALVSVQPGSDINVGEAHFQRGYLYQLMGNDDQAITEYGFAVKLRPDHTEALNNRGVAYTDKTLVDLAIADFNKAIRLQPDSAVVFHNRGRVYLETFQLDRAISDFTDAIKFQPGLAAAYNNRGIAYRRLDKSDLAIEDYVQAIKLWPEYAEAFANRGNAYWDKGELDKAIEDYSEAIRLNPELLEVVAFRGNAYLRREDFSLAIADYDQVINVIGDDAEILFNRGLAHFGIGRKEQAIADLKKAMVLSDDSEFRQRIEKTLAEIEAS